MIKLTNFVYIHNSTQNSNFRGVAGLKLLGGHSIGPSPRYGIYIYFFWSLPNYWGGPGPPGPLNAATPLNFQPLKILVQCMSNLRVILIIQVEVTTHGKGFDGTIELCYIRISKSQKNQYIFLIEFINFFQDLGI